MMSTFFSFCQGREAEGKGKGFKEDVVNLVNDNEVFSALKWQSRFCLSVSLSGVF